MLANISIFYTSPTRTISDFDRFIFNPDAASKQRKGHRKLQSCSSSASQKIKVSSTNNKCKTLKPGL
jgi:hypothetical protein